MGEGAVIVVSTVDIDISEASTPMGFRLAVAAGSGHLGLGD